MSLSSFSKSILSENKQSKSYIFGLDKNIFTLGVASFFNDFSNQMILSAFPAFFTSVLKAGAASLGLVEGIADGAANLLKIYSGNLSDKIQKHRIFILIGYSLSVIIRPFYVFSSSVASVLGLRVIDRVGKGLREAPRDVIISASVPQADIGRSFGFHRAMDTAGGILGPLAAYFILAKWQGGFNIIFISAFFLGLIAIAAIFFVSDIAAVESKNHSHLLSFSTIKHLPRAFRYYLLAIFILSVGSLPVAVLLLKTTSIGLMIASIPLFYMAYSVSYSGFSYIAGKISDSVGMSKMMIIGYMILIIAYIGIGFASIASLLVLSFAVLGLFSAITDSTERAYIGRIVEYSERGIAYGLFNAAVGFGAMISGIAGGYIWQTFNPESALIFATITTIIGLIVFIVSNRIK